MDPTSIADRTEVARPTSHGAGAGNSMRATVGRLAALVVLALVASSLAPREIAIAFAVIGIGMTIADGVAGAVRAADHRRDEQPGGDLPAIVTALVLAGGLTLLAVPGTGALGGVLGTYEIASLAPWIVPIASAAVASRVLPRDVSTSATLRWLTDLIPGVVSACVLWFFASRGKTVTAALAAASACAATVVVLRVRSLRVRPSRRAWRPVSDLMAKSLVRLPLSLAAAILRRLDCYVAIGALGPETAGLWLLARTWMVDIDGSSWSLGSKNAVAARATTPMVLAWLLAWTLVAPTTVRDLLGPRYLSLPDLLICLMPVAVLLWLRSVARAREAVDLPMASLAALSMLVAQDDFAILAASTMGSCLAVVMPWRELFTRRSKLLARQFLPIGLGVLAAVGASDLGAAFGRSGSVNFVVAMSAAGAAFWLWTLAQRAGDSPSATRAAASAVAAVREYES